MRPSLIGKAGNMNSLMHLNQGPSSRYQKDLGTASTVTKSIEGNALPKIPN